MPDQSSSERHGHGQVSETCLTDWQNDGGVLKLSGEIESWIRILCVAISPTAIMCCLMNPTLLSGLVAMYVMHLLSMVLIPIATIWCLYMDPQLLAYYLGSGESARLWKALIAFCSSAIVTVVCLGVLDVILPENRSPKFRCKELAAGIQIRSVGIVLSSMWFSFVNPFLEEFFWRVYLLEEFNNHLHRRVNVKRSQLEEERPRTAELRLTREPLRLEGEMRPIFPIHHPKREPSKLVVPAKNSEGAVAAHCLTAFFYTAYHLVVVWNLSRGDTLTTLIACLYLLCCGIALSLTVKHPSFGLPVAVAAHMGMDSGLVLSFVRAVGVGEEGSVPN